MPLQFYIMLYTSLERMLFIWYGMYIRPCRYVTPCTSNTDMPACVIIIEYYTVCIGTASVCMEKCVLY